MENSLMQGTTLRTDVEQNLSVQQLHSLQFLATPVMDLEAKIRQEAESNPLIEMDEPYGDTAPEAPADANDVNINEDRDDLDEIIGKAMVMESNPWNDVNPAESDPDGIQDMEEKRQYMFDNLANEGQSVQEFLLEQLQYAECSPAVRRAAEQVIGSIDDNGFLATAEGDIAQAALCTLDEAKEAVKLVQTFDPPGIAAHDLAECLCLQIKRKKPFDRYLYELAEKHLEDVARNRIPQIAKAMNTDVETVTDLIGKLKKLNPYPLSGYSGAASACILPEVFVKPGKDGEYEVVSNKESVPRFHISKKYMDFLDDPLVPEEDKKYIREKIIHAHNLENNLEQRERTIMRIARLIVENQHDFFTKGASALRPMTQKEIADKLNLHETTVGRAISGKYLQGPDNRLIPFRTFFSGGFNAEHGEDVSAVAVKEIIKSAVEKENPEKPLSDSKIEKILRDKGLQVARRTIAKYREELGIPSSTLRKVFES